MLLQTAPIRHLFSAQKENFKALASDEKSDDKSKEKKEDKEAILPSLVFPLEQVTNKKFPSFFKDAWYSTPFLEFLTPPPDKAC
jgi:hypothetical protein